MYCPVCGAEYRPGFSVCSDCQVALVTDLPLSQTETNAESSSFVTVWAGDDPLRHAEICEALERGAIPARTLHREERSFNLATQPAFEIFVPADAFNSARAALKELLAGEENAESAPETGESQWDQDENEDEEDERGRGTLDLDPLDADVEIWSGEDVHMAAMIVSSLRENKILCVSDSGLHGSEDEFGDESSRPDEPRDESNDSSRTQQEEGSIRLLVFPQDERRAKKILREIIDATPPK